MKAHGGAICEMLPLLFSGRTARRLCKKGHNQCFIGKDNIYGDEAVPDTDFITEGQECDEGAGEGRVSHSMVVYTKSDISVHPLNEPGTSLPLQAKPP